jgi:hypothetical protein
MQQQRSADGIRTALEHICVWVLDQPRQPALEGQSCDRLRPAQVQRELLHDLDRGGLHGCSLVDWRWDARQGHAKGWLWQAGALQRFCWWRSSHRLSLHEQLRCTTMAPLRALACADRAIP